MFSPRKYEEDMKEFFRSEVRRNLPLLSKIVTQNGTLDPCKWKHGLKPAVPWWFSFDPYPCLKFPGQAVGAADGPRGSAFAASRQLEQTPQGAGARGASA